MGLGLFIAREVVQAHGGTIAVSSTVKEGTIFTVTLPRKRHD
jgi:signal transduction histidine kinase